MASKIQFQTRLDPDDAEAVEDYADQHEVTKAEAVRRLVRAGIDAEQHDSLDPDEIRADLRELREAVEDDQDDETSGAGETVVMRQMSARTIGIIATSGTLGFLLGGALPL